MANIVKINTVDVANIVKLNGVQPANFSKVLGQDFVTGYTNTHSLHLDGSNDYAELGTASSNFFPTSVADWTFSFWVYFETYPSSAFGQRGLFGRMKTLGQYYLNIGFVYINGTLVFSKEENNSPRVRQYYGFFDPSTDEQKWIHVVITNDVSDTSTGFKFYKNGLLKTSLAAYDDYIIEDGLTTNAFSVGRWGYNNASNIYESKFDEVAIHHAALDQSNVTAMYNSSTNNYTNGSPINLSTDSGNYTQSSNLQYWWKFNNNGTESVNSTTNSVTLYNQAQYSSTSPAGS